MTWPVYNIDFLRAVAKRQLELAGEEPSALSIYRRVARLRKEELAAFVAEVPWEPLPRADMLNAVRAADSCQH